jgi:hypothetical protein
MRVLAATTIAVACSELFAQSNPADPVATPGVDQRQARQERRIDQGIASGALTKREAWRLDRQQARINAAEDNAKSDGRVTKQERRRLHHAQGHASRNIYRQKHDKQTAAKSGG